MKKELNNELEITESDIQVLKDVEESLPEGYIDEPCTNQDKSWDEHIDPQSEYVCEPIEAVGCQCSDEDCNPISDKEIIESIDIPFRPIDERILIKPLEPIKLTVTHDVIDQDKMDEVKELDDKGVPTLQTKTITEELESNMRIGIVLAIGKGEYKKTTEHETQFEIGDKVVYSHKSAMPFNLFKDSVLLRKYDILGVWLKDIE